jgi:hypothetical protein
MKRLCIRIPVFTLLILLALGRLPLAAQEATAVKDGASALQPAVASKRPQSAVPGSTEERRTALGRMTPAQRQDFLNRSTSFDTASRSARQGLGEVQESEARWVGSDLFGQSVRSLAPGAKVSSESSDALSWTGSAARSSRVGSSGSISSLVYSGPDLEGDGLPDDFEGAVADAFTPVYHVSGGENGGTGFARFGDFTPLTIIQNLPAVPPASHFRVTPAGFAYSNTGQQYGFLQIDYLTLWNRDDGLDVGGDCRFYASVLGGIIGYGLADLLDGAGPHDFDQERSAVLVAAPTSASFQYATDPEAYQAYDYYTASHEGTFFDKSAYLGPSQPVPANNHLNLGFSRAKHGTYTFNPDGLPLFPDWVIFTTYFTLDDLYYNYYIGDYEYLVYLGMADAVFYSCVVEHFQEQGGTFADPRINVGELSQPLNGSGFIFDPRVQSKLTPLLWQVQ